MKSKFFNKENLSSIRLNIFFSLLWITSATVIISVFLNVKLTYISVWFALITPLAISSVLSWLIAIVYQAISINRKSIAYKNWELIQAVKENRMTDVRFLVWAGADVNYQEKVEHADPWDDWKSWTYYYAHPLDVARSEKAKNFLLKHGAVPCPDTKVYSF